MSISLNGTNTNYLSIADSLGQTNASTRTVAMWVKPANANADKWAFGWNSSAAGAGLLKADATYRGLDGSAGQTASVASYSAGTWYYIYGKQNSANAFALDYGLVASGGTSFSTSGGISSASSTALTAFFVGQAYNGASTAFNGEICCVRIWDAYLSSAELLLEMASATPVKTANLRANWRLATNSDLTSTVNSYTLTANGTVSTGSTEPTDIAGASAVVNKLRGPFGGPLHRLI